MDVYTYIGINIQLCEDIGSDVLQLIVSSGSIASRLLIVVDYARQCARLTQVLIFQYYFHYEV